MVCKLPSRSRALPFQQAIMGKSVTCKECSKVYRELDELEDLRDNDSVCLVCNNTIEVADWDRILASFEDLDDEDDWDDDDEDEDEDEDDLEAGEEVEEEVEEDDDEEEEDDDDDDDEEEEEEVKDD